MRVMARIAGAVLATLNIHTAAIACSCSGPETDAERRDWARRIAAKADAVVEVEPVSGPDIQRQIGNTYRIVKVVAGKAEPGLIRMARSFGRDRQTGEPWMGGSSCDEFPGYRKRVLLMKTGFAPAGGGEIVPLVTLPGKQCGQVLPIREAPADLVSRGYVPVFSFGAGCDGYFLSEPKALELLRAEAAKMGRPLAK